MDVFYALTVLHTWYFRLWWYITYPLAKFGIPTNFQIQFQKLFGKSMFIYYNSQALRKARLLAIAVFGPCPNPGQLWQWLFRFSLSGRAIHKPRRQLRAFLFSKNVHEVGGGGQQFWKSVHVVYEWPQIINQIFQLDHFFQGNSNFRCNFGINILHLQNYATNPNGQDHPYGK